MVVELYSWPSASVGELVSANYGSKILKDSGKFQNAKLDLLHAGNYLHNIYIVFTTICIAFTLY